MWWVARENWGWLLLAWSMGASVSTLLVLRRTTLADRADEPTAELAAEPVSEVAPGPDSSPARQPAPVGHRLHRPGRRRGRTGAATT